MNCPKCGRGITQKYRGVTHPARPNRTLRRQAAILNRMQRKAGRPGRVHPTPKPCPEIVP